jgi:hypothetical protein
VKCEEKGKKSCVTVIYLSEMRRKEKSKKTLAHALRASYMIDADVK